MPAMSNTMSGQPAKHGWKGLSTGDGCARKRRYHLEQNGGVDLIEQAHPGHREVDEDILTLHMRE